MSTTTLRSDVSCTAIHGVELCVQSFGDAADAAILLIGGAAAAMDYWEDDFCQQLAAAKRFVIRYDSRDTGGSTHYDPGAPNYSVRDLVLDALGVADHFRLERLNLAGISMGATIALFAALEQPKRVSSLTLFSTSPGGPGGPESANPDLPPIAQKLESYFAADSGTPDWTNRAATIDHLIAEEHLFAGTLPYDEPARRTLIGRIFDRTKNMASSAINHWKLESGTTTPLRPQLKTLQVPTLILHGTEDPLFPIEHGRALAKELPKARLLELASVGHEYAPRPLWPTIIPAILEHTR